MVNKFEGLPEFVVNISSNLLMKLNKFGLVLFVNNKAKCVFNNIDVNKSLKLILQSDDWIILNKNIEIALYNQYLHHFYWEYNGRFYIVYVYPENDAVWLCFEDVTEKRHLSHLLHINFLRMSFGEKFSRSGYWELDLVHKCFYWSKGVYKLFGIDENRKFSGSKNLIRELILPQDMPLYKKALKQLLNDKNDVDGYVRILTPDKKIKKCRFAAGIFYENGDEKIAGAFVDVSDCMNCGCYNSRCFVKDSDIMMVKVLHDIKQPISAIGLIAEDIKETKSDDINIKINKMLDVCSNLNFMINGMLNFAKNNEIVGEKFNIKDVIMKICDEYSDKIEKRGIKLILKLNSYEVCQNLLLVERIIRNLVDNALKYAKTKFLIKNIGGSFWIVDDGAGIDKIYQKQVFEDFSQCNGLTTANDGSVGLGLGIVKCLASLIGANIKLKSQKNCYTIFRVCL